MTESSPIFSRTLSLMLWLMQHTSRFPKNERFRLSKQWTDALFNFHHHLVTLVYEPDKRGIVVKADIELAKVRTYGRLSHEMALTTIKQYEYFCGEITEIGRLLGGWKKKLAA
jgi:hypothetical protein